MYGLTTQSPDVVENMGKSSENHGPRHLLSHGGGGSTWGWAVTVATVIVRWRHLLDGLVCKRRPANPTSMRTNYSNIVTGKNSEKVK